jgi:hypothetical protein
MSSSLAAQLERHIAQLELLRGVPVLTLSAVQPPASTLSHAWRCSHLAEALLRCQIRHERRQAEHTSA